MSRRLGPLVGWVLIVASAATAEQAREQESGTANPDVVDDSEAQDASFFAVVTVTATGSEVDAFDISTPVSVISAEQIERRMPENAVDVLRDQPGVDANGVGPNQARPIIRGLRGLRVLFMENGLRLNNARRQTDFGETPGLVDMDNVDRVEVVRGPASVLYGTDAVGGVLNLITRSPELGDGSWIGGGIGLRYSSASEQQRAQALLEGRRGPIAFNLGVAVRDSEDYEAAAGTYGDITLSTETVVTDTGVDDDSIYAYLGYDPSDRHRLTLRLNRYRAAGAGFGFVEPELLGDSDDFRIRILYPFQDFDRYTLGYFGSALESVAADSADVQVYYQDNERELSNDIDINIGPLFPGAPNSGVEADTLNFTDLETLGFRAEAIKGLGRHHLLTYGGELFSDDSFNTDFSTTVTTLRFPFPPFELVDVATDDLANSPNATNTSYGLFVQDEIDAGNRLRLTIGGRYQSVSTEADATPGWNVSGLDFDDDAFVLSLNALFSLTDALKLAGSFGTAFRAPNIVERLFNGPTPEGAGYQLLNPELASEESENFDLGLKYRRRDTIFEITYFRNDIDEGIIQAFLGGDEVAALPPDVQRDIEESGATFVVQQRNIDRLRYQGLEAIVGHRFANGVTLAANYTHLDADRLDSAAPPTNDAVSDKASGYIRYEPAHDRFWVEYGVRHVGSVTAVFDANEPLPLVGPVLPSFTVHRLGAGVLLLERGSLRHRLNLVIDNLTDELYAEFSNASFFRPQPKRSFIVSYRLDL